MDASCPSALDSLLSHVFYLVLVPSLGFVLAPRLLGVCLANCVSYGGVCYSLLEPLVLSFAYYRFFPWEMLYRVDEKLSS